MNETIENIISRCSGPKISDECIDDRVLNEIINSSLNANDHGKLKPWKILVFKGKTREILSNAFVYHEKVVGEGCCEKAKKLPYRAPAIVAVISSPKKSKIPIRDQIFSAAGVCQLMTLSAYSLNVSSIWRTGKYAQSSYVKEHLLLTKDEEIIGFIYLGKPQDGSINKKNGNTSNTGIIKNYE